MLLRLILVPTWRKSHATDPCEVPSSSHTVRAVCSLAVRWDRSTSWISVWLTGPAVPVVRQLTVNTLLGVSVSEEQTASILLWQSGSGSCWTSWEGLCPLHRPKSCLLSPSMSVIGQNILRPSHLSDTYFPPNYFSSNLSRFSPHEAGSSTSERLQQTFNARCKSPEIDHNFSLQPW